MCYIVETPTPEQGSQITGLPADEWQALFREAYWRGSLLLLDDLGVDTKQPGFDGLRLPGGNS